MSYYKKRYDAEFAGVFTALVTPFKEGKVDLKAFEKLMQKQIESGVKGVVIAGSTGEGHALNDDEFTMLITNAKEIAKKSKLKIIAGTGTNNTNTTIYKSAKAQDLGVDGVLIVCPYYNKPTQNGLFLHFDAVAKILNIPIILYNVPSRTKSDLSTETVIKLIELHQNIVGLKDATGELERITSLSAKLETMNKDFALLSGEDSLFVPTNLMGGNGIVSVVSNFAPKIYQKTFDLCHNGEYTQAVELYQILSALIQDAFIQANPIPIKFILSELLLIQNELRLPLTSLDTALTSGVSNNLKIFLAKHKAYIE